MSERARSKLERIFEGLGVSPGLAHGAARISCADALPAPEWELAPEEVPAELDRFVTAVELSRRQLAKLKDKSAALHGAASEEVELVLDAHVAMLGRSRLVRGAEARIERDRINAEAAVRAEIAIIAAGFAEIDDGYLAARVEDIRAVGARLIRNLTKAPFRSIVGLEHGTVLLADELTPADTALLDPATVIGFATLAGGKESHTAIMARALGIPAVLGCSGLLEAALEGDSVIVDGFEGTVTLNPTPETLVRYQARRVALDEERRHLELIRRLPSVTRDAIPVALQANLELPLEFERAIERGAEGIGLVRTEFLYMNRNEPPGEEEQVASLHAIVAGMGGREVTIRTLDIGGDKLAFPLGAGLRESPNPALGLRAIRLGLEFRSLLETQLAAILRVAVEGRVRILLPMISNLAQVRETRRVLAAAADRLASRGVAVPARLPPLGIMIEVPGTALAADAFAAETDFFAIGTNDLTQYTLAIDRGDEQVADLFNPLHPGVLRLIQFATAAASRAGIPVSVCGEVAGDPRFTALLLGLGIRTLSMAPANLMRVKQRIRNLTIAEAEALAGRVMAEHDEERIAALLEPPPVRPGR
jgi:phosphotransferase system enzyme I (PtsI)